MAESGTANAGKKMTVMGRKRDWPLLSIHEREEQLPDRTPVQEMDDVVYSVLRRRRLNDYIHI